MSITYTEIDSPLGRMTLTADRGVLSGLYFTDQSRQPQLGAALRAREPIFDEVESQLGEYFEGARQTFDVKTSQIGASFHKQVWSLVSEIPYGETKTYSEIADTLGGKLLARAVGAANGKNPLSIIIPCHRVIGADGSLTGYAGGLDRKRALIELEQMTVLSLR